MLIVCWPGLAPRTLNDDDEWFTATGLHGHKDILSSPFGFAWQALCCPAGLMLVAGAVCTGPSLPCRTDAGCRGCSAPLTKATGFNQTMALLPPENVH